MVDYYVGYDIKVGSVQKMKVYLDTSIISHLDHDDVPEKMNETKALWEAFRKGSFEVFLSTITLEEINECPEPKRSVLLDYLGQIDYTLIEVDDKTDRIAHRIIEMGILKQKSFDDCQHIASAVAAECDCIVSWNFKHLVNIKTIRGIRAITNLEGYKPIEIVSPSALLESEDDTDE